MASGTSGMESPNPNRCSNCYILLSRYQVRHSVQQVLNETMSNMLLSWISPTQLTPHSNICTECLSLLRNRANTMTEGGIFPLPALGHKQVCLPCGKSIARAPKTYPADAHRPERNFLLRLVPVHLVSRFERVCAACWKAAIRAVQRQQQHDSNRPALEVAGTSAENEPHIPVPPALPPTPEPVAHHVQSKIISTRYRRLANTATRCLFNNCFRPERLLIPASIKDAILMHQNLYIPICARVCRYHLDQGQWNELTSSLNDFSAAQFDTMMAMMKRAALYQLDFSNIRTMPPHLSQYWLGMNSEQFYSLKNYIPNLGNLVPNATIALSMYIVKLRTGESNERLATLFNKSRTTLERWMTKARNCLLIDFVPRHLGFDHLSIEDVASRNRIIPEAFFGDPDLPPDVKPAIAICDATYVFLQNSSNYLFQKQTYSLQKLDNLVKPFMIVCCDGHIIDCLGPYKATTNDATITSMNLRNEDGFRSFFRRGDVFLLDRGFRDVISELQEHGYATHMPESLLEGEHQLTTQQANRSRMVTMCRWVVEIVNGRVKRDFRLFRFVFNNRAALHLMDDFKVCCALLNKNHDVIQNPPEALEYVRIARDRLPLENHLANYVAQENLNRRSANFEFINSNHPHLNIFPRLTIDNLKRLALGSYQIKQAVSYYGERVRHSGIYNVEINNRIEDDIPLILGVNNYMLRGRIKSRHVNSRTYYVYLLISRDQCLANTLEAIKGYCCNCLVGRRTLGCCAHVMTVVWYLSWARYSDDLSAPAQYLDNFFDEEYDE